MIHELTGYADRLSVAPGGAIAFKVSTDFERYGADIVRLIHGDENGPGFKEERVAELGEFPGEKQIARAGSYGCVPHHDVLCPAGSFTLCAWVFPTAAPKGSGQGLVSKRRGASGYALGVGPDGDLTFWLGDGVRDVSVGTGLPLECRRWTRVAAVFDAARQEVRLLQAAVDRAPGPALVRPVDLSVLENDVPLLIAATGASGEPDGHFNGKIERPTLVGRALTDAEIGQLFAAPDPGSARLDLVAAWDFSVGIGTMILCDSGPHALHGTLVNAPTRAVTGHGWAGSEHHFRHAPAEYGAIHFHDDDLEDAAWKTSVTWQLPAAQRSGVYALRLTAADASDRIPFVVRPGSEKASVLLLLPTMTYLAYADESLRGLPEYRAFFQKRPMEANDLDLYLAAHPEFGLSIYDKHSDGSGVCHSSFLRPIPNMRPDYRQWQFGTPRHLAADLYLIDWLEAQGIDYHVITDHDLHHEGMSLLDPYDVVLSGTHPEYWTGAMRTGLEAYLQCGGSHMYLGGNGYYWVTSVSSERPHLIEVRRGNAGGRAWTSAPGELHHSTTGELGGLWRHRGLPPNQLVGIGFRAMGYDSVSPGYRRLPGSFDPRAAFIFEGVSDTETIGDFGLVLGGAAGDEVDSLSDDLPTPRDVIHLATATGHGDTYSPPIEEHGDVSGLSRREQWQKIRADMVYFETGHGGAVFSVGSISWCGSLSHNNYDNNVSRITGNVLRKLGGLPPGDRRPDASTTERG
ncbi:LamG domain-containing protein [Labrys wisconsinensis]|uniref:N,N-dimethylformamidase n=1 Tax=Labrys wisconsinensis TaxID=425677 RepID=A0ABU0JB51_9HYPH|nr:LamG domain-containing protein [Labrys wisconsinensis]MDQ0471500.1 N,N-dimethylformamidase [Labrys wisconsinensis]